MKSRRNLAGLAFLLIALALGTVLASCAPAAIPTSAPPSPAARATEPSPPTEAPEAQPTQTPPGVPTQILKPIPTEQASAREARVIELEWPPRMKLGESDTIRLSLLPSTDGYTISTEFPGHQVVNKALRVQRPVGYDLQAAARLEGVAFKILPDEDQVYSLPVGESVTWHWTLQPLRPGQQRLSLRLALRWAPLAGTAGTSRETLAYSKGLDVQVASFLGMSTAQTFTAGWIGLILGGSATLIGLTGGQRKRRGKAREPILVETPDERVEVQMRAGLTLEEETRACLQALFQGYRRLFVESEFQSGYSGARTLLVLPARDNGRTDAHTIVKLGQREAIETEYASYEAFVKDSLPPVTARIQSPPVRLPHGEKAALRYTFIGKPGAAPASLRQALLDRPDPWLLKQLFETFGPNWWLQRQPHTFHLADEYDRLLPAHYAIEPAPGPGKPLDGRAAPETVALEVGDRVTLAHFNRFRTRSDGEGLTISASLEDGGGPGLRLRGKGLGWKNGSTGRVTATRMDLLRGWSVGFQRADLPDPLDCLPALLQETVSGTRSIIHGDLNLENVLVGPGGMLWLIDFAETREGHPLFDFAHLEAEIIAHVLAPRGIGGDAYIELWRSAEEPLLREMHAMARACSFHPGVEREYDLALYAACLGGLKHANLGGGARELLYLTAACVVEKVGF